MHRRLAANRELPLRYWLIAGAAVERLAPGQSPLVLDDITFDLGRVNQDCARQALKGMVLSHWTLDVATINHLTGRLAQLRPTTIVECGSGASTLVLAAYCQASDDGSARPHVYALEQSQEELNRTEDALRNHRLDGYATVLLAPVVPQHPLGLNVLSYDISASGLLEQLTAPADFLLIDGPAGPDATRLETLPHLRPYCTHSAFWLMDDALRPGELKVLAAWRKFNVVSGARVLQVGKGIAEGFLARGNAWSCTSHRRAPSLTDPCQPGTRSAHRAWEHIGT